MIKKIYLKNLNNLNLIEVDFNPHINIIIGPKGGGKSTLFFLLVGLDKNIMYEETKKALKEYGFEFVNALLSDGTEIKAANLSLKKLKNKNKIDDFDERFDVIYQDDPIKKELTTQKDISKKKEEYIINQMNKSNDVNKLISNLKDLYLEMKNLYSLNDKNIKWSLIFQLSKYDEFNNDNNPILKLNYDNKELINIIDTEINNWNQIIKEIKTYDSSLKTKINFNFNELIKDENFNISLNSKYKQINDLNNELEKILTKRIKHLMIIKKNSQSFKIAFDSTVEKIKNENKESAPIVAFKKQAEDHFKNIVNKTKIIRKKFEDFRTFDEELSFENEIQSNQQFTFKIKEKLKLNEEQIADILKILFYVNGAESDLSKWLDTLLDKGVKKNEFDEESIKKKIKEFLLESTQVMVEGNRDYENLSLGQKSIYGFKYKFNKSINSNLYIDQPEDNLDNNTIATEILPLINKKKDHQVFIITHNANIGILSNPENIIICDLNKPIPYKSISFKQDSDGDSVDFLEGGKEFLEKRFNKIMKGDWDEINN